MAERNDKMNTVIANPKEGMSLFRWRGREYVVLKCELVDGRPVVEVQPSNEELEAELARRLQGENGIRIYHGFGYKCSVEDYAG